MVRYSGMLLMSGWDIEIIFILDQVIRHEDQMYAQEFGEHGSRVNPSIKTFVVWSKAPNIDKPLVLYEVEQMVGDAIVGTLKDTIALVAATISILYASHFAKLFVEEQEKIHERLKVLHISLTINHNRHLLRM